MRSAIVGMLVLCVAIGVPRAEPAGVEPRVVGTWQMTMGAWTTTFEALAAGQYRMHTTGPSSVPDDSGSLGASGGAWRMQKASGGPVAKGTYAIAGDDTLTLTLGGKTVTWHRTSHTPLFTPSTSEADAEYQRANALVDKKRYREALPLVTDAANRGLATAQNLLGYLLQEGEPGIPKDAAAAAGWFAKAAAQGNRAAQFALGGMIEEGEGGLTKDPRRAAELYEASAKQGLAGAQFAFGLSCEFVLNDRARAIQYLELAGAQGEGMAGWIAKFLRRPGTPHFKNEVALTSWMNLQVWNWMKSSAPADDMMITKYYRERAKMFYERGDSAAGDRCKYHGSCY